MKFRIIFLAIVLMAVTMPVQVYAQCGDPPVTDAEPSGPAGGSAITFWPPHPSMTSLLVISNNKIITYTCMYNKE